jgi:hypothetical protein
VLPENSVRSKNTGVPTIREIMVATTFIGHCYILCGWRNYNRQPQANNGRKVRICAVLDEAREESIVGPGQCGDSGAM